MKKSEERLTNILVKVLLIEPEDLSDDIRRKEYEEWDSMAHLLLVSEIENEFGVFFEDEEVIDMWTVGDVKAALQKKLAT
ncbi:acyl carrier protein [Candidatus Thorarchaeota archaeon]|jgi:acyl carrier protein|nr:MAG: acyl carrier protein [Candidatus Thorarchaeota archaeon]